MFHYIQQPLPAPPELTLQQPANRPPPPVMQPRPGEAYGYVNGDLHGTPFMLTQSTGPQPHSTAGTLAPQGSAMVQQQQQYLELASFSGASSGNTGLQMVPQQNSLPAQYQQPQQQQQQQPQQFSVGPSGPGTVSTDTSSGSVGSSAAQTPTSAPAQNNTGVDSTSKLWKDLKMQLEYYFSPQNLEKDDHLKQNMDIDGYVPIAMIATFNKVVSLTKDVHLVTSVLRDSTKVQVDPTGEKVRPLLNSGTLMLREIPESTPVTDVERLFDSAKCPRLVNCYFGLQDHWYATFETHNDAVRAYTYLKEDEVTFRGKPVLVRIKSTAPIASYSRGRQASTSESFMSPPPTATQVRTPTYPTPALASAPMSVMPQQQPVAPPVYQEPPPPQPAPQQPPAVAPPTRVFTPQPVVQQQMPPTVAAPPPAVAMPTQTHQLPPGTVQLVPAPQNYPMMQQNPMAAAWTQPFALIDYTGQMLVQRPAIGGPPVIYDFGAHQRLQFPPDVRYRTQQRTYMVPVVTPGFPNPGGATAAALSATNIYTGAMTPQHRPPRRDSTDTRPSRFNNAPRPSSAPYLAGSVGSSEPYPVGVTVTQSSLPAPPPAAPSRLPPPPVTQLLTEMPATVDVASATDLPNMADVAAVALPTESAVTAMPLSLVNAAPVHMSEPAPGGTVEPAVRKAPPPNNWRHADSRDASSRSGPRQGRRGGGGRHYDDAPGKSWNAKEQPSVEQKYNFEATGFPPLTSTHTTTAVATSIDEGLRYATLPAGGSDERDANPVLPITSDATYMQKMTTLTLSDAAVPVESNAVTCARLLNDGGVASVNAGTTNDVESLADGGKQQSGGGGGGGSGRLSYAQIISRGGKDLFPVTSTSSSFQQQMLGESETTAVSEPAQLTGCENTAITVAQPQPPPASHRPPYHHHHGSDSTTPPHHTTPHQLHYDVADRHVTGRRGGRGSSGMGSQRPYRTFYPSESAQGRGSGRYRGHLHDGYSMSTQRTEQLLTDDQPSQVQQS
jgi:hypothetical protein